MTSIVIFHSVLGPRRVELAAAGVLMLHGVTDRPESGRSGLPVECMWPTRTVAGLPS